MTLRVGAAAVALAVAAMVVDHLLAGDWPAFLVSAGLSVLAGYVLFAWFIPRTVRHQAGTSRAAIAGVVFGVVAIVPGVALMWLGFPIVVAGAGLALGLIGWSGNRPRLAAAAVALGAVGLVGGFSLELAIELTDDS